MSVRVPLIVAVLAAVTAACGPPSAPKPAGGPAKPAASASAAPPVPSGLPPMAEMPPPGVKGSKKAKVKEDGRLWACAATPSASGSNSAAARVKAMGEACAGVTKMHAVGGMLAGAQAAADPHAENRVKLEAGKCYRVYFAFEVSEDAVLVLRDSAGDIVAESHGPALPEKGTACFDAADDATLLFAAGSGKGAWAAQVWSD